jgi:SAM-dependent methyltransferase
MKTNDADHFSSKSDEYSFHRPHYPDSLFEFLSEITRNKNLAWDCATGNGQAAIGICKYFKKVIASDASKSQIEHRFHRDNIVYDIFPAEKANIQDNSVDLITVAQAAHWFDLTKFYQEVKRVSNGNEGIIAIWAYGMHKINPEIDMVSEKLTVGGQFLGNYWPKETIYVKQNYKTIPFPFKEIAVPKLEVKVNWNLDDLFSYMETWSSVKKFQMDKKYDPLSVVKEEMKNLWGIEGTKKVVRWTINLRVGIIQK